MSSRIHRGTVQPAPILWSQLDRAAGAEGTHEGTAATATEARRGQQAARDPTGSTSAGQQEALLALGREMEQQVARAREQGRAEGEAAAAAGAKASVAPSLQTFQGLVQALTAERERVRKSAEQDVVKLALAVARRVLHRELATDPEAVLGLVKSAWEKVNARETHRLRVSSGDAAVIEMHRATLGFPTGLTIVADGSLSPGNVVFETARGQLDASVDTQLNEIERGLTDILVRRTR